MKTLRIVPLCLLSVPALAEKVADAHEKVAPGFWNYLLQPKFITMFLFAAIALALLLTRKLNEKLRIGLLILATFFFGIAGNLPGAFFGQYAMHPSPICASTKPFLYGLRLPFGVTIAVILILTLIGPKLFCSYVCPVGASQELMAKLSRKLGITLKAIPTRLSSFVRILFFGLLIGLSVTMVLNTVYNDKVYALSIYDYINPFHGFEFHLGKTTTDTLVNFLPLVLTLILAIRYYRPFCYAVCPVGLFSQWLEPIGLFKLTFHKHACTDCGRCTTETGCPAVPEIMKDAQIRPDCFACNRCVTVCPTNALSWGLKSSCAGNQTVDASAH